MRPAWPACRVRLRWSTSAPASCLPSLPPQLPLSLARIPGGCFGRHPARTVPRGQNTGLTEASDPSRGQTSTPMPWLLLFLSTAWPERPARALPSLPLQPGLRAAATPASSEFPLRLPMPPGPRGLLLTFLSAHATSPGTLSTASRPDWVLAPCCMLWQQREPLLQSHYPMR